MQFPALMAQLGRTWPQGSEQDKPASESWNHMSLFVCVCVCEMKERRMKEGMREQAWRR